MIFFLTSLGIFGFAYNYGWLKGYEDQKKLDENLPFRSETDGK